MFTRSISLRFTVTCSLCFCLAFVPVMTVNAQTTGPKSDASVKLAAETAKIKDQIAKIGKNQDLSVKRRDGKNFHGFINKIDDESFTMSEVDLRTNVELRYDQIKKVKSGYGKVNNFTGKHGGPQKTWIFVVVLAALVALPIILVASAKD